MNPDGVMTCTLPCYDPFCILNGCRDKRRKRAKYSDWPYLFQSGPAPMGCICPPTSEQTCGNRRCPRKGAPAQGTSGSAQDPKRLDPKGAGPVHEVDAPK